MPEKKEPQSFALVIEEADGGSINRILSRDLATVIDHVTTKANLHETEWKGEITVTLKIKAEPNGKIEIVPSRKVKHDEEKMPKARMYWDPDTGALTRDLPRQVKIPGFDDDGNPRKPKSAAAPKAGDN